MNDYKKIIKDYILNELLSRETMDVDESTSLIKSGLIDSIDIMRLITFLMEELGFTLEVDEYSLDNFDSIEKINSLISKKNHNNM